MAGDGVMDGDTVYRVEYDGNDAAALGVALVVLEDQPDSFDYGWAVEALQGLIRRSVQVGTEATTA